MIIAMDKSKPTSALIIVPEAKIWEAVKQNKAVALRIAEIKQDDVPIRLSTT